MLLRSHAIKDVNFTMCCCRLWADYLASKALSLVSLITVEDTSVTLVHDLRGQSSLVLCGGRLKLQERKKILAPNIASNDFMPPPPPLCL